MVTTKQYLDSLVGKWVAVLTPSNFHHEGFLVGWDGEGLMLGAMPKGPPTRHIQRGSGTVVRPVPQRMSMAPPPFQNIGK